MSAAATAFRKKWGGRWGKRKAPRKIAKRLPGDTVRLIRDLYENGAGPSRLSELSGICENTLKHVLARRVYKNV